MISINMLENISHPRNVFNINGGQALTHKWQGVCEKVLRAKLLCF